MSRKTKNKEVFFKLIYVLTMGTLVFSMSMTSVFFVKAEPAQAVYTDGDGCGDEPAGQTCEEDEESVLEEPPACAVGPVELVNPSFEEPVLGQNWDVFSSTEVGWKVKWLAPAADAPCPALLELQKIWTPAAGEQYAELDSDYGFDNNEPASVEIYQDIKTVPSATYELTFSFSARPNQGAEDNVLGVKVTGENVLAEETYTADGTGESDTNWQTETIEFTADSIHTRIAFSDLGEPDSFGTLLDNISLKITNCVSYADYCGDGEINQEWEQCDGGEGCTETCQLENEEECSDLVLARVNVESVLAQNGGNVTADIFLGSAENKIPAGVWFPLYWQGNYYLDPDMASDPQYEDVPGLAVQRLEGSIRAVMHGSLGSKDIEHIHGNIEFYNAGVTNQQSDDSAGVPKNNKLEKGFDGKKKIKPGQDEVWQEDGDSTHSYFWLTTNTADDGFYTDWEIKETCLGSLTICKYYDANANGELDGDDQPLGGWRFSLNMGEDGEVETGEEDGCVTVDLAPGEYLITEIMPEEGWCAVEPVNGEEEVEVFAGENTEAVFLNTTNCASISGCKYNDENNNGEIEDKEPKLSGWEIELWHCLPVKPVDGQEEAFKASNNLSDYNLIPLYECGEGPVATTTTGDDGCYQFNNLEPGIYKVNEVVQDGWWQTYPSEPGVWWVTIEENGQAVSGQDFANYHPECGNGILDDGEECDDGNQVDGDGCSASCAIETSSGGGGPYCGDGTCDPNECCESCPVDCGECSSSSGGSSGSFFTYQNQAAKQNATTGGTGTTETPTVAGEEGAPSLVVEKTIAKSEANPGDKDILYTVRITNNGNLTAFGVTLTDVLPDGLSFKDVLSQTRKWTLGDIAPGDTMETNYFVNVDDNAEAGAYTNTVTVTADNHNPVTAQATLTVKAIAVLAETGFSLVDLIILLAVMILTSGGAVYLRRYLLA